MFTYKTMGNTPKLPLDPLVDPNILASLNTGTGEEEYFIPPVCKHEILNILPPENLKIKEPFPPILQYPDPSFEDSLFLSPYTTNPKPGHEPIIPWNDKLTYDPPLDLSLFEGKAVSQEDWQAILDSMDFDAMLTKLRGEGKK